MTCTDKSTEVVRRYREVISLHEQTLRYLQSIEFDADMLQTYKALLHHLRTRTDEQIPAMLGMSVKQKVQKRNVAQDDLADSVIERLTLDQVREQITAKSASRRLLERIAAIRFGVTKGAISSLKSRDILVEKIMTLISNEGTHSSIARVVENRNRGSGT